MLRIRLKNKCLLLTGVLWRFLVVPFCFFLMHTSHYPKLTTPVNRYGRAATLQIPFCAFCLPGHPDTSFVTALETLGHALPLTLTQTPSNADHQLPGQITLPLHPLLFFWTTAGILSWETAMPCW